MTRDAGYKGHGRKNAAQTMENMDWESLIDRAYPNIMWRYDESVRDPFLLPTPVLRMKRTTIPHFFGLFSKEIMFAILTSERKTLDNETLLATLGLVIQGQNYFTTHPRRDLTTISGPKSDIAAMRALLKSDIFAAIALYLSGHEDGVKKMVRRRAEAILTARKAPDPSLFALPAAMDTINVALPKLGKTRRVIDRFFFDECLTRAEEICRIIDRHVLGQWYGFGQAAQDMAWRGVSKRSILGAAYLADSPDIRALAVLIADMTGLAPHGADQFIGAYSAFCDMDMNAKAHDHAMDQEFAWIVAQDPVKNGSKLFYEAADRQIDDLHKGRVLGWCADALHVSAKAFLDEGGKDRDALDAAKIAFDAHKARASWQELNALGEDIVERSRQGKFTSLQEIANLSQKYTGLQSVMDALEVHALMNPAEGTMPHVAPTFSAPAAAPAPQGPAPTLAPAAPQIVNMPVFGGPGGSSSRKVAIPPITTETDDTDL